MTDQLREEVFASGKLFELVHVPQPDGRVFELARRAPGVRLIICNRQDQTILLTKEFRQELSDWDCRLPGGKVFDSLVEYEAFRTDNQDILIAAENKARAESIEETGIEVEGLTLFKKSTLGATVEWDLFVFEAVRWHKSEGGQQLEAGEQIEADTWVSFNEARSMILRGDMREERIALILLQWINQQLEGETV